MEVYHMEAYHQIIYLQAHLNSLAVSQTAAKCHAGGRQGSNKCAEMVVRSVTQVSRSS